MSYSPDIVEDMKTRRIKEKRRVDENITELFPMRLCIVGGKYDQFQVRASLMKSCFIGAGLKLRMKNNQKGFNFNFLRDDSKFI